MSWMCDLHMHSNASDGLLSAEALVDAMAAGGVRLMALTDHDDVSVPTVYTSIGAAQFTTMTLSPPIGGWIADRYGMAALFPVVCLAYAASVGAMCLLRSRPMKRATPGGVGDPAAARRSAWAAGVDAYRDVLMSRQVRLLLLNAVLVYAGIHLALSFAPLYLREAYAYDAAAIGPGC